MTTNSTKRYGWRHIKRSSGASFDFQITWIVGLANSGTRPQRQSDKTSTVLKLHYKAAGVASQRLYVIPNEREESPQAHLNLKHGWQKGDFKFHYIFYLLPTDFHFNQRQQRFLATARNDMQWRFFFHNCQFFLWCNFSDKCLKRVDRPPNMW